MDGILCIDKPVGWTSFDVVAKVRGAIRHETGQKKPKVGHTGTLDPLASGLLVLVVGSYCKRAAEFSKMDKLYEVEMTLGATTATDDAEAEPQHVSLERPAHQQVVAVLQQHIGAQLQRPPAFSAIKVGGQRSYALARAGKSVELEPRLVHIHKIELESYDYPKVLFRANVGSGTYIRSLVRDVGEELGTGAYMSALRRTEIGEFHLDQSVRADQLDDYVISEKLLTNST